MHTMPIIKYLHKRSCFKYIYVHFVCVTLTVFDRFHSLFSSFGNEKQSTNFDESKTHFLCSLCAKYFAYGEPNKLISCCIYSDGKSLRTLALAIGCIAKRTPMKWSKRKRPMQRRQGPKSNYFNIIKSSRKSVPNSV